MMKKDTRNYVRILDAQNKIYKQLSKLTCCGNNWQKEREQTQKLEKKLNEFQKKLDAIQPSISQDEFETHLTDRMCCTWEDFQQ